MLILFLCPYAKAESVIKQLESQERVVCSFSNCKKVKETIIRDFGLSSEVISEVEVKGLPEELESVKKSLFLLLVNKKPDREVLESAVMYVKLQLKLEGYYFPEVFWRVKKEKSGYKVFMNVVPGEVLWIKEVEVFSPSEIKSIAISIFKTLQGKFLKAKVLKESFEKLKKELAKRGYFNSAVDFDFSEVKSAFSVVGRKPVVLKIFVKTGKKYAIKFEGNTHFPDKKLLSLTTFFESYSIDEFEVKESSERIEKFYKNNGFPFVKVSAELKAKEGIVIFKIREGRKVLISEVKGVGKKFAKRLKNKLFNLELVESVKSELEKKYRSEGFAKVKVNYFVKGNCLCFDVEKGKKFLIEKVVGVPKSLEIPLPQPYTPSRVSEVKELVENHFRELGYRNAKVSVEPRFFETQEKVKVVLKVKIEKGNQYRVGFVLVRGLERIPLKRIKNLIILRPGDVCKEKNVSKQYFILNNSGLFSAVSIDEKLVDCTCNYLIDLKELPKLKGKGFIGAGSDSGLVLSGTFFSVSPFGFSEKHLLVGNYRQKFGYDVMYRISRPAYPFRRFELNYSLVKRERIYESFKFDELTQKVFLTRQASKVFFQSYGLKLTSVNVKDTTITASKSVSEFGLFFLSRYDKRNNSVNPSSGFMIELYSLFVPKALYSDCSFLLGRIKGLLLLPLPGSSVLALRAGIGSSKVFSGELPLHERFFLGGAETVRGYKFATISPRDEKGNFVGGKAFGMFSVEIRKNVTKRFQVAGFYDSGRVFKNPSEFRFSNWFDSVGAGLRYITPVGALRFDVGYKLKKQAGRSPFRIHVSFGFPF